MSLVTQFHITLKDFWPDHPDGMFITDRDRGTTTTISRRLYAELKAYAEEQRLPFESVAQQLREEIHSKPIANNDPTATTPKFAKGDRVGARLMPRMDPDRTGTIVFQPREEKWVAISWDGTRRPRYIDPDMLERADD
jgi:hypothetical protein